MIEELKKPRNILILLVIVFVFIGRYIIGLQINFSHLDYIQIYRIGLGHFIDGSWPYWGPDIYWSKRQVPGALQAFLVTWPMKLTGSIYSPFLLVNLISYAGVLIMAWYAHKRFSKLPFILIFLFLAFNPYTLMNGAVLLNTAYLLFTGAILFVATGELFIYRDQRIIKSTRMLATLLGFAFFITFQLHLTWVMFLPFLLVFTYLEFQESKQLAGHFILYFFLGGILPAILVLPTIYHFFMATFFNAEGSLAFDASRILKFFDVLIRYLSVATFNINPRADIAKMANESISSVVDVLNGLKIMAAIQTVLIIYGAIIGRKEKYFGKFMLVFALSLLMVFGLYLISNKHLSTRTSILLWPIPIWLSFYAYQALTRWRFAKPTLFVFVGIQIIVFALIGAASWKGPYSVYAKEAAIKKAIATEDADAFAKRRVTISPLRDD